MTTYGYTVTEIPKYARRRERTCTAKLGTKRCDHPAAAHARYWWDTGQERGVKAELDLCTWHAPKQSAKHEIGGAV